MNSKCLVLLPSEQSLEVSIRRGKYSLIAQDKLKIATIRAKILNSLHAIVLDHLASQSDRKTNSTRPDNKDN